MRTRGYSRSIGGRSGFTMIELIFVIVILGILASVAIPKFSATRTDAKISTAVQNIKTMTREIANYYTSQGKLETDATAMSNIATELVDKGDAATENNVITIKTESNSGDPEDCVKLDWSDGKNIKIIHLDGSGEVCSGVKSMVKENTIQIAGKSVRY